MILLDIIRWKGCFMKPIVIKELVDAQIPYNIGMSEKTSALFEGAVYMFKPAEIGLNGYEATSESEYIGSHIYQILDIPAHETLLVMYKGRPGVFCKDFIANSKDDLVLYEFASIAKDYFIKEGISSPHLSREKVALSQVLQVLNQADYFKRIREEVKDHFWKMFILDSFIENYDRHIGNWGYILNRNTGDISIAPIYDCAGSFNPQRDDDYLMEILAEKPGTFLYNLEFTYQTSALRDNNPNIKMTLQHVISNLQEFGCIKAIQEIVPKIESKMAYIIEMIDSIEMLSDARKEYIKTTLKYRLDNILVPAYKKAIEL